MCPLLGCISHKAFNPFPYSSPFLECTSPHIKLRMGKSQIIIYFFLLKLFLFPCPPFPLLYSKFSKLQQRHIDLSIQQTVIITHHPLPHGSAREGRTIFKSHGSHLQGIKNLMGEEICVCVIREKRSQMKKPRA